jgi:ATP-dependent helicase/nuclease subunit A
VNAPAYRIDGRTVGRAAFYAAACDPRANVVVEACAGAGKTWMLVSRIVRALLAGAQPHEVLAITFTRKAAGEMRERLARWLREFSRLDDEACAAELRERGLADADARAQAAALRGLHARMLESGRAVEVRTFHAWFSQLLRAAPLDLLSELGLATDAELIEDTEDLKPELMRRFHAAVLDDAALARHYRALVASRGRFLTGQWLDAALQRRVELERADRAGTLEGGVPLPARDPDAVLATLRDDLLALARRLGATGKLRAGEAAQRIEAAWAQGDPRATFEGCWQALFTDEGSPRKQIGALPPDLLAALQALRDDHAQRDAHDDHGRMTALSRCLLAEYAALKRQRALVDMNDLEQVALALLADSQLSGWVQQRLDARVRHLLIDEFQDTSPLQWQALHAWLSAYAGTGGGARDAPSVFIVGDPKQSIYRFRRAEPRVFDAARHFVAEGLQGQVLECDHTRRNAPQVLAAVNAVFGVLGGQGDYAGWREHSTEVSEPAGAVLALPGVERPPPTQAAGPSLDWRPSLTVPRREPEQVLREAEARQVALGVAALVRGQGVAPGDVLVLCRKRESLRLAADALQALHLPYTAPEDVRFVEVAELRDLIALLDVLASPGHALSLAHALKSPLFGAGDDDLLALAEAARGRPGAWWPALMAYAGASAALARARDLLAAWAPLARSLPPHDLLDRVVHEGDVRARFAAAVPAERRAQALQAIDALLAQALQLDGGRNASVYGFVRALRRRKTLKLKPAARADAVQLLTIHGAKGLEARAVFVMDTDPERRNPDLATLLVDWPVDHAAPRSVAFVANEARCPPSLVALLQTENAARAREEWNGLYVAMTRSRETLVLSRTAPLRASPLSWWPAVSGIASPWAPPPADAAEAAAQPIEIAVLPAYAPAEEAVAAAAPTSPAAALGRAVHRVLEWAAHDPQADRGALALAACRENALPRARAGEVRRLASQVLDSSAAARFFDASALAWAGNEVPVADAGEVLRIDRLVRLHDGWWVLDYKLNHHPSELPAHRLQLARYRRAVRQLVGADEPVRAAFIAASGEVVELAAE